MINYYQTLGIDELATDKEIKQSYRKLANVYHPDKGGDTAMFQELQEAYSILSNPSDKTYYDNDLQWYKEAEEQRAKELEEERLAKKIADDQAAEVAAKEASAKMTKYGIIGAVLLLLVILYATIGLGNMITYGFIALIIYALIS